MPQGGHEPALPPAAKPPGDVARKATSFGAVEQSAATSASLDSLAVRATFAHRHSAGGLLVPVGLVPLRLRELLLCSFPSVVVNIFQVDHCCCWSDELSEGGLEARTFDACCSLAGQEADVLSACDMRSKAEIWLRAVARAGAARRNISNFGPAFRLSDARSSEHLRRCFSLHLCLRMRPLQPWCGTLSMQLDVCWSSRSV